MAEENPLLAEVSRRSGLPEKSLASDNPLIQEAQQRSGKLITPDSRRHYEFSGLEASAGQINLTNTYTDPLENYTSYGVPRNAFADWNDIRAENQSTAEKWARGLTKAGITALGAVAENTVGVAGGLLNLAFGENHSYYDNPVGRSIDSINEWAQEVMPNYYTKREQEMGVLESLGTANFWADKFANGAGYTLGSLATAWLGVGEGAMLAKMANVGRMSKIAKAADKAMDITQDAAKFGSKQFQLYNAAKVVNSQTGKTIAKGIDQGLAKMAKQAGIKTAAKNLSVGLHMSLAEASVEAREVKNKFIEEQTAKWEEANPGQEMPAEVEDAIIASASAAGNVTFGVNLPLLVTTNAISFGKMFLGIKPTAEAKLFDIKKVKDKWVEAIPDKGMAKAFAKANRIVGAPLRNSISEGAQEAGQFITAEAAGDYYSDKFADGTGDMVEAFTNGLSKSIGTKEGLESILIGALVGGGSGTISTLFGADKKFNKAKTANTQKALEILNSEGFGKVLENMEQSQRNMALVKEMGEATTAGEFKKAELARRKLISSVANQYRKAGALDFAIEQLDDLKQLDEEEFKKRWGYDASKTLKEQTGMEQGEIIDDVKSKMERSVKRQEQVQDILRAQQPSTGLFARILDSFESEELRKSKTLESSIKNMYANVLLNRLEDVDAHDDLVKQAYKDLREMAPVLAQIPEEDFEYMVKTGAVEIDKDGEVKVNDNISSAPTKKLADKLNEVFKAKYILNPEDARQFTAKAKELGQLVALREGAAESYKALRDKPEDIALLVEAEVERRKQDDKYKNKQQAQAAIQNSESVDELNQSFPKNAEPEDIAAAMAKREELLAKEDAIIANYKKMSKEEFDAIDPENLSPLEESAYKRYKKKVDEMEAEKNFQKDIGVSFPDENAATQATASYEEVLSDIEARTFGEVMVNPDGNTVTINGRTYSNLEDDPLDALLRDEQGTIVGVRMTDMATGNEVTWKSIDPADSSNLEVTERENAIAEGLAYMTLLKAASIRPNQTVPLSEAKEQLEPKIQAAKEDAEVREKFEENTESTDSERELAKNNLSKTAGLTDDQLRAQIETLKADLEEINEIITAEEQIAREAGFTKKEFDADPQTKELRAIKKRITQILNSKIKTLRDRKQSKREEALDTKNTEAEVENSLSPEEEDLIKAGLYEEIKKLEDDMLPLTQAAKGYQDIIDGKYGEGQDVAAAAVSLKETNKKIGVIKAKITKRRNLINKLNEERELEKLRQDRDSAERAGIAPEGQEPEGKDINPGTGTPSEGLDGILDEAEVEKLRQQREEAERLRKQQEQNKKAQEPTPKPVSISPAPITISKPGELDVRLAKGEKMLVEGKVRVSDTGTSLPSDNIQQTTNGGLTPIIVNQSLSSNPAVAPTGTQVRFEVREDTDWWISQSPNIPADEHWKTVPIYMVVKDAEGVEQKVALLQSATETSGQMRRDIYNLYKQGLTPVATSAGKIFDSTNYSNTRIFNDATNRLEPFFYPAASLMQTGQTPAIAIVGVKDTVKTFKVATQGAATFPNLEDTVEASDASKLTLGQVAIVTMDPNGKPILVMASTRNMTESGRTAALAQITAEVPSLGNFAQIVGTNLLLNDSVDPSQNENVYTEINDEMQQEYSEDAKNFMLVETLADGTELITFFSPSANSLVRMNAQNMKLALAGAKPMFSFIEVGTNEKGFKSLVTTKKDDSVRSVVEMKLADEFKAAIMKKRFQVDKTLLNNTESYTSPITGEVYPSYFQYLNSEKEVAEERTEGKGTKAILAVDTEVNSQKSPFFDVGIKTTNLGTLENDVIAAQDLAAKQIAAPTDNKPTSYPITETTAAPISDIITQSDIERYGEISYNTLTGRITTSFPTIDKEGRPMRGLVYEKDGVYYFEQKEGDVPLSPEDTELFKKYFKVVKYLDVKFDNMLKEIATKNNISTKEAFNKIINAPVKEYTRFSKYGFTEEEIKVMQKFNGLHGSDGYFANLSNQFWSKYAYSLKFGDAPLQSKLTSTKGNTYNETFQNSDFYKIIKDAELAALGSSTTAPVSDKKADIERRRQEDLKKFGSTGWGNDLKQPFLEKFGVEVNGWVSDTTGTFTGPNPKNDQFTVFDLRQIINAKYDAELATLERAKPAESKVEVISENYTPELLRANPDKLFLFGDNNTRTGKGGQAIIRDEPNAMGISTKLKPSNASDAFMSDDQLGDNKAVIDSDIKKAKDRAAKEGKTIVLPKGGFGTGLAALATKAPKTFEYLNRRLQEEFGFNNTTGELAALGQPSVPVSSVSKGVEISSNAKGLAAALTNPTELAKRKGNLEQSYPVEFEAVTYPDAEAAYQAMKKYATKDEGPKSTYNLMVAILKAKLQQYPRLVNEIAKQGGSAWILSSTHQPTKQNSVWETGGKNWFIKALNEAYINVSTTATPAVTQPSPSAPSEEKVTEITGAEDTGGIFDLFGIAEEAPKAARTTEDVNPETGLPSFFDSFKVDNTFVPPGNIEDFAAMAARNKAQAEEIKKQCKEE